MLRIDELQHAYSHGAPHGDISKQFSSRSHLFRRSLNEMLHVVTKDKLHQVREEQRQKEIHIDRNANRANP